MPAQLGLLHTWSHLHKTMKKSLRRFFASDSEIPPNLEELHLPSFYRQVQDRGFPAAAALKIKFKTRYDDRLPLVAWGNAALLRLTVAMMLDYVMERYSAGVGYTAFEMDLIEEGDWDYIHFTAWRAGVGKNQDDGIPPWFSPDEMERLVAGMGGAFFAEKEESGEPRCVIRIPLIPGDPSAVAADSLDDSGLTQAKDGATALVVDNSPISRVLGAHLLSRHNIAADDAESGQAVLKKLAGKNYDLIFMGYSLPGLNGIQTAAIARARGFLQNNLVIGMGSGADAVDNIEAVFLEAGMHAYLPKPVDPLKLNLLLQDLLPRLHKETTARAEAPAAGDGAQEELLRSLSGIAGLNAAKGLANMGHSADIYAGMLRRFTAELEEYIEPLLTLPGDGAWEEVALRLHVLHEFFSGIGAEELAQEAASLAAAADAGGDGAGMPRLESYCDAMMRLRASLVGRRTRDGEDKAAERRQQARPQAVHVDLEIFKQYVSRLHDACLSYRATEAQTVADELRKMAAREDIDEEVAAICGLVDTLDYHEACERCARLLATIETVTPPENATEER